LEAAIKTAFVPGQRSKPRGNQALSSAPVKIEAEYTVIPIEHHNPDAGAA